MAKTEIVFALLVVLFLSSSVVLLLQDNGEAKSADDSKNPSIYANGTPFMQGDEHNHQNSTEHNISTDNIEQLSFNRLTSPGNAEISVARSPDGNVYTYQAGWNDIHIIDVTNPYNTTVVGIYNDPNTQVLDVKYLEYNGREYVIAQNQLVDSGYADPNIGEWSDPAQISITLIDVTDKEEPCYVDSWFDSDHPTGPHNLYTHVIDGEWYIFVANPDYEQCDSAIGEACGGITIAHLNLQLANSMTCTTPYSRQGSTIIKVGEAEVAWETTRGGWIYIHDMTVQSWPGTDSNDPRYGKTYIYGAYWEAGLRIFDVSDVPHPTNSPELYTLMATTCKAGQGNPVMCRWRAPEVGAWMNFLDLDGDGQPDSQTNGNENGGRVSYIHYVEPFPVMLDVSHLGLGEQPRHYVTAAAEVLSTTKGTGLVYFLDTTNYILENGNMRFSISMAGNWEIPEGEDNCFGSDCEEFPIGNEWLLFSPHNLDSAYFVTDSTTDASRGGGWDGRLYVSSYHAGLWILDVETIIALGNDGWKERHTEISVGWILPVGDDGTELDSQFYDFGWAPFLWTAEHYEGRIYTSCISSGLFIVQLDIDKPFIGQSV